MKLKDYRTIANMGVPPAAQPKVVRYEVPEYVIADKSISAIKLDDELIARIDAGGTGEIEDKSVTIPKLGDDVISYIDEHGGTGDIKDGSVTMPKLGDDVVEYIDSKTFELEDKSVYMRHLTDEVINSLSGSKHFNRVATLIELYTIPDGVLSVSGNNTGNDAIGQVWYVTETAKNYTLIDWSNRSNYAGWKTNTVEAEKFYVQEVTTQDFTVDCNKGKYCVITPTGITNLVLTLESLADGEFGIVCV
ncbi:MAG: hypothetical protein EOM35_07090 [Negativicutes bacterium]|nr:hypothetical protein [Negativicutes bacterium]